MSWYRFLRDDWDRYYPKYLQSETWKKKREKVFQRDGHLCICGETATEVHHKRYDNVGKEPLSDLVSLCKECHSDLHLKLKEKDEWNRWIEYINIELALAARENKRE